MLRTKQLVDIVQDLSLATDIETITSIVRTAARELTGADGATFVLRDNGMCYYADEDAISPLWKGSRFPMETCISGWTMLNKKSVIIEDIYKDERIPIQAYKPTFVKSLVMVPIRTINPIGAIGNYWAKHYSPSENEVQLLQTLADITAVSIENIEIRNHLEQQVIARTKELSESLDREKKMGEIKSSFVSIASHEFKTPLATILSSISLIDSYRTKQDYEKQEKHILRIKSSVQNLSDILNDFLSLDKLNQGKITAEEENFDLEELLNHTAEELDDMKKPGQEIILRHEGNKEVDLDAKILRNIMLNLLSNAIKYSEKNIYVNSQLKNHLLTIAVKDEGMGIPEEEQENVFQKFFRSKQVDNIQGTGLGLNIVKGYTELMKGEIDFVSTPNVGTTFTVKIPIRRK